MAKIGKYVVMGEVGRGVASIVYSTLDPESIGSNVTSGCTGLLTQDMLDLYSRTPVKTKVIVLPA